MKRMHIVPTLVLVAPLLAGACAGSADQAPLGLDAPDEQHIAPMAGAAIGAYDGIVVGELQNVDLQRRTLIIRTSSPDGDAAHAVEFVYDEMTDVVGADGERQVQALTGMGGAHAAVTYRLVDDVRQAVRIELAPSHADDDVDMPPAGVSPATP